MPGVSGSGGRRARTSVTTSRTAWYGRATPARSQAQATAPAAARTLSNSLCGASYSNSYVYTHLGQLWQGPLSGGSTQEQYLYCNSPAARTDGPLRHAVPPAPTRAGQGYTSSYDASGNVTSRTYSGTTGALTYDLLDHFDPVECQQHQPGAVRLRCQRATRCCAAPPTAVARP